MAEANLLHAVRPAFRAIARTVVPETAELSEPAWTQLEAIVEHALGQRPPRVRRQVSALIRLIEWMALARHGRPFSRLDAERRTRLLRSLQDGRVLLLRRGVWGLRTLVFMGYYAHPDAAARIGYRAALRGWLDRGAAFNRVPLPAVAPAAHIGALGGPLRERPAAPTASVPRDPGDARGDEPDLEVSP